MPQKPRRKLSDRYILSRPAAAKGDRDETPDSEAPGLALRVTDRRHKTFVLVARFPKSPNPTRRALGDYGVLSLAEAREKARTWQRLIRQGVDPCEHEAEKRAAEMRRRKNTFGAIAEDFFVEHLKGQRRAAVSEREIRRDLISAWGARPITGITSDEVSERIRAIKARGAERQAHNVFAHGNLIFRWAIGKNVYGVQNNPFDRLRPNLLIGRKNVRNRVLNDFELRLILTAAAETPDPYGAFFRLLLLTGQRKAEVAEMRWREIDFKAKLWTIPPERFKSGAMHLVPLSEDALALLKALRKTGNGGTTVALYDRGDFVFSTTRGEKPINGFSKAKENLDSTVSRLIRSGVAERDESFAPVEMTPWVLHDLRRTVRSRLSALRIPDHVAELVIGHARKGIQGTYDLHKYLDERREALDHWARFLGAWKRRESSKGLRDVFQAAGLETF